MADSEDFTRVVGMESREQVEAFAWETNLATEIESTGEKQEREHGDEDVKHEEQRLDTIILPQAELPEGDARGCTFLLQLKKFNLPRSETGHFYTTISEFILKTSVTIW